MHQTLESLGCSDEKKSCSDDFAMHLHAVQRALKLPVCFSDTADSSLLYYYIKRHHAHFLALYPAFPVNQSNCVKRGLLYKFIIIWCLFSFRDKCSQNISLRRVLILPLMHNSDL